MKGIDLGNLGNDRRLSASCHGIAHNYSYHWGHPDPYLGPRVHQPQVVGDTVSKGPLKGSALKPIQKWGDQVVAVVHLLKAPQGHLHWHPQNCPIHQVHQGQ